MEEIYEQEIGMFEEHLIQDQSNLIGGSIEYEINISEDASHGNIEHTITTSEDASVQEIELIPT